MQVQMQMMEQQQQKKEPQTFQPALMSLGSFLFHFSLRPSFVLGRLVAGFPRKMMNLVLLDQYHSSLQQQDSQRERWSLFDLVKHVVMFIVCFCVGLLRLLLDHFPSPLPLPSSAVLDAIVPSSSIIIPNAEDHDNNNNNNILGRSSSRYPIGRALSQVLTLVNDIPVTSRKYEFARDLADKIIEGNDKYGHSALQDVNRKALSSSFARTLKLLNSSLVMIQRQQKQESSGWTWKFLRMIPLQVMPSFENLRGSLANLLQLQSSDSYALSQLHPVTANNHNVLAEKSAQELLWLANRLGNCSAMDEAITQWSTATRLAAFSITAHPRVQGYMVRISAICFKEIAKEDFEIPEKTRFKLLILWLPLLCYAVNGIDSPVLSPVEKAEVERVLERTIAALSDLDQEVVLANWLHDYAFSASDWPNLERCYDNWCQASRKLV